MRIVFKTPVKVFGEYLDNVKEKVFLGTSEIQNNRRVIQNSMEAGDERTVLMN